MKKLMVGLMLSLVLVLTACGSSEEAIQRDVVEIEILVNEYSKMINDVLKNLFAWSLVAPEESEVAVHRKTAEDLKSFKAKSKDAKTAEAIVRNIGVELEKGLDSLVDGGALSKSYGESIDAINKDLKRLNGEVSILREKY